LLIAFALAVQKLDVLFGKTVAVAAPLPLDQRENVIGNRHAEEFTD